jgi:hypothetical protein
VFVGTYLVYLLHVLVQSATLAQYIISVYNRQWIRLGVALDHGSILEEQEYTLAVLIYVL